MLVGLPFRADRSAYFGSATFYFRQPFQPSTRAKLNSCSQIVNAAFRCNVLPSSASQGKTQLLELLISCYRKQAHFPVFHRKSHSGVEIVFYEKYHEGIKIGTLTGETRSRMVVSDRQYMSKFVAYVDGGSLGNPGPSGIGVVVDGTSDGTIRIAKWIGHQDNNVAEYVALLEALQCALGLRATALHVFSDSEVVVRQMKGEYGCRSPRLYSLHWICRKLAGSLDFSISHVRRENNVEANRLASSAARWGRVAQTDLQF
jgi:ribonuclease HI